VVDGCRRSRGFGDLLWLRPGRRGQGELYLEVDLKPWDVAPMQVLLEEAGGRLTDFSGRATIY